MLLLTLLWACSDGPAPKDTARDSADAPGHTGETGSSSHTGESDPPVDTAAAFCRDAPDITYASFGRGFMTGNCQGCHASTAENRHDAPEDYVFDTVEDCWRFASSILAVATPLDGDDPSMPPLGGVTDDDRTRLMWWLLCAEPGT